MKNADIFKQQRISKQLFLSPFEVVPHNPFVLHRAWRGWERTLRSGKVPVPTPTRLPALVSRAAPLPIAGAGARAVQAKPQLLVLDSLSQVDQPSTQRLFAALHESKVKDVVETNYYNY